MPTFTMEPCGGGSLNSTQGCDSCLQKTQKIAELECRVSDLYWFRNEEVLLDSLVTVGAGPPPLAWLSWTPPSLPRVPIPQVGRVWLLLLHLLLHRQRRSPALGPLHLSTGLFQRQQRHLLQSSSHDSKLGNRGNLWERSQRFFPLLRWFSLQTTTLESKVLLRGTGTGMWWTEGGL